MKPNPTENVLDVKSKTETQLTALSWLYKDRMAHNSTSTTYFCDSPHETFHLFIYRIYCKATVLDYTVQLYIINYYHPENSLHRLLTALWSFAPLGTSPSHGESLCGLECGQDDWVEHQTYVLCINWKGRAVRHWSPCNSLQLVKVLVFQTH